MYLTTVAVYLLIGTAAVSADDTDSERRNAISSSAKTITVRIMTFNAWMSGQNVENGMIKVADQILSQRPDIVGMQEIMTRGDAYRLNELLRRSGDNWVFGEQSYETVTFTRHKIVNTNTIPLVHKNRGAYTRTEVAINGGESVVVWNAHLDPNNYGPYIGCNKAFANEFRRKIYAGAQARTSETLGMRKEPQFEADRRLNRPMIVLGDFNEPSHLDWTAETSARHCGRQLRWPVSDLLAAFQLVDAYRLVNPDVAENPGVTWSPLYSPTLPVWGLAPNPVQDANLPEPQDRIDFIYFKNTSALKPLNCKTFSGSKPLRFISDSLHKTNDWPSDHSSVVCDFLLDL